MIITDIKRTKAGRYSLFINGEFAFSVTSDQMIDDGLRKDLELSEKEYEELQQTSGRYFARDRAISLLSRRSYTRYQLSEKLKDLADPKIINEICDRMEEIGLIDDEDYARRRSNDLYNIRNFGQYRVYQDLLKRGINKNIAMEVSTELEPENSKEIVLQIIEKKHYRRFEKITDRESYYKCINNVQSALVRMGHSFENIDYAINSYVEKNNIEEFY